MELSGAGISGHVDEVFLCQLLQFDAIWIDPNESWFVNVALAR